MGLGFANAIGELALVVFTTLAPAAAVGYALSSISITAAGLDPQDSNRCLQRLFVPLLVCMVGLIASAAHLGNPANVLYVLTGVGRSPLSNEVASAVVFLALAGTFWLYSFSLKTREKLQHLWTALIGIAAFVFVLLVSLAYKVDTIPTWDTVYAVLSIWCNALAAGPLMAILTLKLGGKMEGGLCFFKPMAITCLAAVALGAITYLLQGFSLYEMGNYVATTRELFPYYWLAYAIFIVLSAASVLARHRIAVSCALMFAAIFVMRFAFYTLHLTAGLGV